MIDPNRSTTGSSTIVRAKPIFVLWKESRVLKNLRRSTGRVLRVTRSFFEGIFRSMTTLESSNPRTYAALAGDGLMPEVMPPLATDE
jgi:hypothetical protein